jgi:ParB family chromosome partitioning protein
MDVLDKLRQNGLTERHGRALLRLGTAEEQRMACCVMVREQMNVARAEEYIESLLAGEKPETPAQGRRKTLFILKDVRIFLNTLSHGLELMKRGGIDAGMEKKETDKELILTISIPKQK